MSNVKKLFVVPEDFFESVIRRQKIIDDPLIGDQMKIEKEKELLLHVKKLSDDEKVIRLEALNQKENIVKEQREAKKDEGAVNHEVYIPPTQSLIKHVRKKGRPKKLRHFDIQIGQGNNEKQNNLLNNFFLYEPKGKSIKHIKECIEKSNVSNSV